MKTTLLCVLAALSTLAGAQSFNVDIDQPNELWSGPPGASFGGAGSPGVWNTIFFEPVNGLLDLSGTVTSVSLAGTHGVLFGNLGPYTGDDLLLMGDTAFGIPNSESFTFSGLADGLYEVIVYAQWPTQDGHPTPVTVAGEAHVVEGVWSGSYVLGESHTVFSDVVVDGGSLIIEYLGVVNGIQIVPEPGTIAAFGIGLILLSLQRRR